MLIYLIVAVIAYLLGSIPFGYILVRMFRGEDVRAIGSGNIGATNVARKAPGLGVATLVLDALKGYAAVYVGIRLLNGPFQPRGIAPDPKPFYIAIGLAAVCAILGHLFPVWLRFKGGKGVATGVGVFLGLVPKAVLIVLGIFALIFVAFRYVSLASIIATAAFPVIAFLLLTGQDRLLIPFMAAASLLIIAKHHQNIRRLLAGTEHRFELKHR
jgi:glycerol-3-phosphate acyltransferase PlsY